MATIAAVLTYIKNSRITEEDSRYLLSSDAQGRDCIVAGLRAHVRPQMVKGGKNVLYIDFKKAFDNIDDSVFSNSNTDLEIITAAFESQDSDFGLDYADIFESWIQFALYEIYSRNEQEGTADDKKKTAIDILSSLFGDNTTPFSELRGGGGGETESSQVFGAFSTPTDENLENETYGFKVLPRGRGGVCNG